MAFVNMVQTILECFRCGHRWTPRNKDKNERSVTEVRICPKCKSPYWDRPKA